jgi:hypothetical protein
MTPTFKQASIVLTWATAVCLVALLATAVEAAEPPKNEPPADPKQLVGQPVDMAPWAYAWRADREVQEKPEAYFIPRRLKRFDEVYRTIASRPTETVTDKKRVEDFKTLGILPAPKGGLQSALLWLAPVPTEKIEIRWPEGSAVPPAEAIEVRVYPSKVGWFGALRDEVLPAPAVSADGRTLTYLNLQTEGSRKGKSIFEGTDMVAVFFDPDKAPAGAKYGCPTIHLFPPQRKWIALDLEIEWGLEKGAEQAVFDGRIEAYGCYVTSVRPLPEDKGTEMTAADAWKSAPAAGGGRRGIVVSLLHPARFGSRGDWTRISPLDARITLWTKGGNLTFLPDDVNFGPVLVPGAGMFIAKAGGKTTGRAFAAELAAKNLKTIPQMTREHPEAASWEEVMRNVKLAYCPPGTVIPPLVPFEEPPATAMQVTLPDERWTDAWRRASWDLNRGKGGYGYLALEAAVPIRSTDLCGHHETATQRLEYWLKAPGVKADGDFVDGDGSFEYATTMQHDIGWYHDGTHPQTGRVLFAMAEHYFLTGDKEWFEKNRTRIQAAADWILRQRELYLKDIPNRKDLAVAGLQPPQILGDIALGRSSWRWFLIHDAFSLQGLRRFADALEDFDPEAARLYHREADAYAKDLLDAVEREIAGAPVRQVLDGTYRRIIPASPYTRGSMVSGETLQTYGLVDNEMGALPLAEAFGALAATDPRIGEHLDVTEERILYDKKAYRQEAGATRELFWKNLGGHVKYVFVDKIHLYRDDVPCFLRTWMNYYSAFVTVEGGFTEGNSLNRYTGNPANKPSSDLGSTGWFIEGFRNLLVMEQDGALWLARATPRAWLEQGKKISVKNAPTYFGPVGYEIVSDVENGTINATVEMPVRKVPPEILVRFRHPKSAPIKAVTVNGEPWTEFNQDKETITLKGLSGTVSITAQY